MPVWNSDSLPAMFQERHNTKEGTWAKLRILQGELTFALLTEEGEMIESFVFNQAKQPMLIEPQVWHRIISFLLIFSASLNFSARRKISITKICVNANPFRSN